MKYEQSVRRVSDSESCDSSVYAYKFLKSGLDVLVLWDSSGDEDVVTVIGGCHSHRKEVLEIVNGTDVDEDEVEEDSEAALFG